MQHAPYRDSRETRRRADRMRHEAFLERFAVRFAEVALLAGIIGAGIALFIAKAG